jgi:hypothetical protein
LTPFDRTLGFDECRSSTAVDNLIGRLCKNFPNYIGQMIVPNGLIAFLSIVRQFLLGDATYFKIF